MAKQHEKNTPEKESRFYIAKTVIETKQKIGTRIKTYNEKYVKKQFENGREFITELKSDPVKKFDDIVDDSKNRLRKAKSEGVDSIQKKVDTTRQDVRRKIEKINQKSQRVYKGIENDAKLLVEDFMTLGRKNLDKIPMKKTIEKKISAGIDSIPVKLNLPSKDEVDHLVTGIDDVNKKVDALNKQFANA